jgi:hypothetical protein
MGHVRPGGAGARSGTCRVPLPGGIRLVHVRELAVGVLQLFSFVVFSAVLIHHGSAESKDGTDRIEEAVKRIESRLDEAGIGAPGR